MKSQPALAVAASLVILLQTGCAGEGPGLSGAAPQRSTSGGSDYAHAAERGPAEAPFDPFAGPATTAPGGREVIEKPTFAQVLETGKLPEMSWGKADAPVIIVKYASLTCPYCRKFHQETFPQLKRDYIDSGKVRFVIREFPIGKTSGTATIALRCAPADKYLELYAKYLALQAAWVSQEVRLDPVFTVASQVGMTRAQFDACLQNHGMIEGLKWVKERGRKLGVIGTPNFFVNGRLVKSQIGMKEIRELVDPLLARPAEVGAVSR